MTRNQRYLTIVKIKIQYTYLYAFQSDIMKKQRRKNNLEFSICMKLKNLHSKYEKNSRCLILQKGLSLCTTDGSHRVERVKRKEFYSL